MIHYYAQRKGYKNDVPQTPGNYYYTDRREAERQYYLLNASACTNNDGYDFCSIELGTVEQGAIERRYYNYIVEEPEVEPEVEPGPEEET